MALNTSKDLQEIDWVQLRKEMDSAAVETGQEKFVRKFKENPLVPIGCVTTAGVLMYGLWCFRLGNSGRSQIMMRARIAAQGFTVAALIVGIGITATKVTNADDKM